MTARMTTRAGKGEGVKKEITGEGASPSSCYVATVTMANGRKPPKTRTFAFQGQVPPTERFPELTQGTVICIRRADYRPA
ncbi:MAG: hypothetical protein PHW63_00360 [Alphaproteobacteria bacterium]|nr:hypothetical protein [Alphaproteobacteria bacterium]